MSEAQRLLEAAKSFCESFGRNEELPAILSHFAPGASIIEHGIPLPELPFLGKVFGGENADDDDENETEVSLSDYFKLLNKYLNIENEPTFYDFSTEIISLSNETVGGIVTCKGKGVFVNRKTGKKWGEVFIYRLDLDRAGRIKILEIWSDTLSAYLATKK